MTMTLPAAKKNSTSRKPADRRRRGDTRGGPVDLEAKRIYGRQGRFGDMYRFEWDDLARQVVDAAMQRPDPKGRFWLAIEHRAKGKPPYVHQRLGGSLWGFSFTADERVEAEHMADAIQMMGYFALVGTAETGFSRPALVPAWSGIRDDGSPDPNYEWDCRSFHKWNDDHFEPLPIYKRAELAIWPKTECDWLFYGEDVIQSTAIIKGLSPETFPWDVSEGWYCSQRGIDDYGYAVMLMYRTGLAVPLDDPEVFQQLKEKYAKLPPKPEPVEPPASADSDPEPQSSEQSDMGDVVKLQPKPQGAPPQSKPKPEQQKKERVKPLIVQLGEQFWGAPAEVRAVHYENRAQYHIGRIVIDPNKDRWFDFENNSGGGVNDLMRMLQEKLEEIDDLEFIDIARRPLPAREWLVEQRIPALNVTIFSGEGAGGKSIIALMLSAAVVMPHEWLGLTPTQGPVIYLSCEDDDDEICRRLDDIADYYGTTREDLKAAGLHAIARVGKDAILALPDHDGRIRPTKIFEQLHRNAVAIKPKLIVIDTSADVFGGNELSRVQVGQFINLLRKLAIDAGAAVVLISHPSLRGLESGSGISGSTAWHNRPRARIYLLSVKEDEQEIEDEREIEFKKNNYGPKGETIHLYWKDGVFTDLTIKSATSTVSADQLFLQLLDRYSREGRTVNDKRGPSFAPTKFSMEPEAKESRVGEKDFAQAMLRLFQQNVIKVETEGSRKGCIIRTGKKGSYAVFAWSIVEDGVVPEGATCAQCHKEDGELKLVQGLSKHNKPEPEVLHWDCARAWFRPGDVS